MKTVSKTYLIAVFILILILGGCGPSIKITPQDIGKLSLSDFDMAAKSKGYGRWYYKDYYNYKLVGWNKFGAMPYYAVFDEKDFLVEYLDNNVETLSWDIKNINLDKIKSLQLAKAKALQAEKERIARHQQAEQERKAKELQAEQERRSRELLEEQILLANLKPELLEAEKPYICNDESSCKRAFTLTQIFISENAEMKIQLATDAIIETYGSEDKISMKATKVPGSDREEYIFLNIGLPYYWSAVKKTRTKINLLKSHREFLSQ